MLLHIYKNLFIQMLRRAGYSKKQAKTIYARFLVELQRERFVNCSLKQAERCGMAAGRILSGANWSETKQGQRYWYEIYRNLCKKGL